MFITKYASACTYLLLMVFPCVCLDAMDSEDRVQHSHIYVWGSWNLQGHRWHTPLDLAKIPAVAGVRLQQVSMRGHHILALDHEGKIHVWGPDGSDLVSMAPEGRFSKIAGNNMAIDADGNVHVWGNVTDNEWARPPQGEFIEVAKGSNYYAIDDNGYLHAWGRGVHPSALNVPKGKFRTISAYGDRAAAIDIEGHIHEWGHQHQRMKPANQWHAEVDDYAPPPDGSFKAIAVGKMHSVAIDEKGRLHSWGVQHHELAHLYNLPNGEFISVTAGNHFSAAVDIEGRLYVWGDSPESPLIRFAPKTRVVGVAAGSRHAVAILDPRDVAEALPQPPRGRVVVTQFEDLDRVNIDVDGQEYVVRLANVLPFSQWPTNLTVEQEEMKRGARDFVQDQLDKKELFLEPLASLKIDDMNNGILADLSWAGSDDKKRELQGNPSSIRGYNLIHLNILLVEMGLTVYVSDVKNRAERRRLLQEAPQGELSHLAELQTTFKRPHEVEILMAFEAAEDRAREEQRGIWAFPELVGRLQDSANDMDMQKD